MLKTDAKVPYQDDILLENVLIPANHTYYYTVTYEFKETGVNQDIDQDKNFTASIVVSIK